MKMSSLLSLFRSHIIYGCCHQDVAALKYEPTCDFFFPPFKNSFYHCFLLFKGGGDYTQPVPLLAPSLLLFCCHLSKLCVNNTKPGYRQISTIVFDSSRPFNTPLSSLSIFQTVPSPYRIVGSGELRGGQCRQCSVISVWIELITHDDFASRNRAALPLQKWVRASCPHRKPQLVHTCSAPSLSGCSH